MRSQSSSNLPRKTPVFFPPADSSMTNAPWPSMVMGLPTWP
jgi:hypothetical protein